MAATNYTIAPPTERDRAWIASESKVLGGPVIVSAGQIHDLRRLPAVVLCDGSRRAGFAVYRIEARIIEILAIKALQQHRGIGSAMLLELERLGHSTACTAIRMCTTNDNLDALRFYQRRGFIVCDYRLNGMEEVRRLKGDDSDRSPVGHYGIPVRDVIELSKLLS